MKSNWCSLLLVGLVLLLLSFTIGCGQSQSQAPPPMTTPTQQAPPTTQTQPPPVDESKVHFEQGNTYLEQEEWYEAIAEYTKAIKLNPDFAEAYANRAVAYLEEREYSRAGDNEYGQVIADWEKAVELNPLIEVNPRLALAYAHRGESYFKYKDYDKAVADYTMAMKIDPLVKCRRPHDIYAEMAQDSLIRQNYDEAITYLTKAMELDPENTEYYNTRLAEAYCGRGVRYLEQGKLTEVKDDAIADFSKAIELDPTNANYYLSRGEFYYELARYYWDASEVFKEADVSKAITGYTISTTETGEPSTGRWRLQSGIEKDSYIKAITDYTKAIELGIESATIYNHRGNCYAAIGNNERALADYRKALELSEDDWLKEQTQKNIEELEAAIRAKYIIKDLAYIKIMAAGYSDDADPESDGISLRISFYDSKSEGITFQGIPVTVTIELYSYISWTQWGCVLRGEKAGVVYRDQVTIDHSEGFFGAIIKIPHDKIVVDQNRYYKDGDAEVTVTTPKQGSFRATCGSVELYPYN